MIVVKAALAQTAGIKVLELTDSVQIATAFGTQLAKVAKGRVLSIKNLTFENVDVAVCDACVPAEAQAVLGGPVLQQVTTAFDESTSRDRLHRRTTAPPPSSAPRRRSSSPTSSPSPPR